MKVKNILICVGLIFLAGCSRTTNPAIPEKISYENQPDGQYRPLSAKGWSPSKSFINFSSR